MKNDNKLVLVVVAFALIVVGAMAKTFIQNVPDSKATVMVKAQAPDAQCTEYGTHRGIEVSVCTLPSTPNKDTYVSVYGSGPWQVYQLKPAPAQQTAAKATPAAPPDAGAGSGSGSGQGSGKGSGSGAAKK